MTELKLRDDGPALARDRRRGDRARGARLDLRGRQRLRHAAVARAGRRARRATRSSTSSSRAYGIDRERAAADAERFVAELAEQGLLGA